MVLLGQYSPYLRPADSFLTVAPLFPPVDIRGSVRARSRRLRHAPPNEFPRCIGCDRPDFPRSAWHVPLFFPLGATGTRRLHGDRAHAHGRSESVRQLPGVQRHVPGNPAVDGGNVVLQRRGRDGEHGAGRVREAVPGDRGMQGPPQPPRAPAPTTSRSSGPFVAAIRARPGVPRTTRVSIGTPGPAGPKAVSTARSNRSSATRRHSVSSSGHG